MLDPTGQSVTATWFGAATVVLLVLTYVVGWVRRVTTRYLVTDRRIQIRSGHRHPPGAHDRTSTASRTST